jgi:hypothetical protein
VIYWIRGGGEERLWGIPWEIPTVVAMREPRTEDEDEDHG